MKLAKALLRKRRKKESVVKYIIALLHLWLGLLSSLVIFTVCLTGTIYAFKNQVLNAYNSKVINVTPQGQKMPIDGIWQSFKSKGHEINSIIIPQLDDKSLHITYTDTISGIQRTAYFNPYTARETGTADYALDSFFSTVLDIHRTLLLSKAGKQVVGISVLIFVFMLLSGLVLWWPKKLRDLKKGLTIKFKAKFYRLNYDLHNTLGFYAFFFLLFIALTGLYITYPWVKSGVIVTLGGSPVLTEDNTEAQQELSGSFDALLKEMVAQQEENASMKNVEPISLDSIIKLSHRHLNYEAVTTIKLPDEKDPRFTVTKINTTNWLGALLPDVATFNKKGELKSIEKFADKPLNKQFVQISKPLHTGEIMGLTSIIFYAIISFIGCMLPITGFIIWYKKIKEKNKSVKV